MKIKNNYIAALFLAVLACFSLPSCMNLDEKLYGQVEEGDFGKNEAEIRAIIGPVYNTLKRTFSNNLIYMSECAGDMAITPTRKGGDWYDGGNFKDLHMHSWTAETNPLKDCWEFASTAISLCNMTYSLVENKDELPAETKKILLSEIRGVRAYWLYIMLDYYGNVPLKLDFVQDEELPKTKSRKDVYDTILKELNEIKDNLQSEVNLASYGKFTKGAAYTLLAKLYLNAEAWGVDTPKWEEAAVACDSVMKLNYILEPDWKINFTINNNNSQEAILAACYNSSDEWPECNNLHRRTLHYLDNIALGLKLDTWNGICAQTDYAKLFVDDDKRKAGSFLMGPMIDPKENKVIKTKENRDLDHQAEVTIIPGSEMEGTVWGEVHQEDGYRAIKWTIDKSTADNLENDFHIFRLADVYLMKAEALVRLNKDNAEATSLVNKIRERGFGDASHNYSTITLAEIELERKLELAWECHSRQDCIRFGTYQNARFLKPSTVGKDYLNLYPIPQNALDANSNLVQNPGY